MKPIFVRFSTRDALAYNRQPSCNQNSTHSFQPRFIISYSGSVKMASESLLPTPKLGDSTINNTLLHGALGIPPLPRFQDFLTDSVQKKLTLDIYNAMRAMGNVYHEDVGANMIANEKTNFNTLLAILKNNYGRSKDSETIDFERKPQMTLGDLRYHAHKQDPQQDLKRMTRADLQDFLNNTSTSAKQPSHEKQQTPAKRLSLSPSRATSEASRSRTTDDHEVHHRAVQVNNTDSAILEQLRGESRNYKDTGVDLETAPEATKTPIRTTRSTNQNLLTEQKQFKNSK